MPDSRIFLEFSGLLMFYFNLTIFTIMPIFLLFKFSFFVAIALMGTGGLGDN
mgnify:CR=1 FL=1